MVNSRKNLPLSPNLIADSTPGFDAAICRNALLLFALIVVRHVKFAIFAIFKQKLFFIKLNKQ